jgi:hypothetical protein
MRCTNSDIDNFLAQWINPTSDNYRHMASLPASELGEMLAEERGSAQLYLADKIKTFDQGGSSGSASSLKRIADRLTQFGLHFDECRDWTPDHERQVRQLVDQFKALNGMEIHTRLNAVAQSQGDELLEMDIEYLNSLFTEGSTAD